MESLDYDMLINLIYNSLSISKLTRIVEHDLVLNNHPLFLALILYMIIKFTCSIKLQNYFCPIKVQITLPIILVKLHNYIMCN